MNRRKFLKSLFFTGAGFFLLKRTSFLFSEPKDSVLLRPPGSLDEESFRDKCVRCGACVKVCPARCLKPMSLSEGLTVWLTPHIIPRQAGCLRCSSCSQVCPSGAIQKIETRQIKIGTASINCNTCLVWTEGKSCLVCLEYCPVAAVSLDKQGRPVVNPRVCAGCGLCEQHCPVLGDAAAIRVAPAGEKRYFLKEQKYRIA